MAHQMDPCRNGAYNRRMFVRWLAGAAVITCTAAGCGQAPILTADSGTPSHSTDAGVPPLTGVAAVSGGALMSSPNYQLITTTGQGPGSNATMSSRNHVLVGGVAGTTQGR